jgi:hypothetical protein
MYKYIFVLLLTSILFLGTAENFAQHKYTGVSACAMCHKTEKSGNQFGVWNNSLHSKAFETLKSAKAKEIVTKMGLKTEAYESPECLKCHTTGYGSAAEMFDAKFKAEDGVQCESCHGAGSDYKSLKIMKNREDAVKNGLNNILVADGSAEKLCKTCHNEGSPNYKGFNFEEYWNKIKHPKGASN